MLIKPDSMLVEPEMIATARASVMQNDPCEGLDQLATQEPPLGHFVSESAMIIAGKAAFSGAPTEVTRGVHEDVVTLVLVCLDAVRQRTYEV